MRPIVLPLRLASVANAREHWAVKHRRQADQSGAVYMSLRSRMARGELATAVPAVVTIVRVGPRMLDTDNLASSAKHIRDSIAKAYGVDDGPAGPIEWRYAQRSGEYAIEIQIQLPEKITSRTHDASTQKARQRQSRDISKTGGTP